MSMLEMQNIIDAWSVELVRLADWETGYPARMSPQICAAGAAKLRDIQARARQCFPTLSPAERSGHEASRLEHICREDLTVADSRLDFLSLDSAHGSGEHLLDDSSYHSPPFREVGG